MNLTTKKELIRLSKLILRPDEQDKLNYEIPYLLDIKLLNSRIFYIGVDHTNDPQHQTIQYIEKQFLNFVSVTDKGVVICGEGQVLDTTKIDKKRLIEKNREVGLLYYLAEKNNYDYCNLAPSEDELFSEFLSRGKYDAEDLALWIFLNILNHSLSNEGVLENKKLLVASWEHLKDKLQISDFLLISEKAKTLYGFDLLPMKIDDLETYSFDKKYIKKIQSPYQNHSLINEIAREMNLIGDFIMFSKIYKLVQRKKNIFAVAGHNHVVSQERALRAIK